MKQLKYEDKSGNPIDVNKKPEPCNCGQKKIKVETKKSTQNGN
jgi:hypothetical protein